MADVAALTGDTAYVNAIDKIWENVAGKKLYITGGIGATAAGEAFGGNYELPNMTAYNETCAAIGNDYWNHRLFLLHADAKYINVMERTLYNGLISGVSLDGKSFSIPIRSNRKASISASRGSAWPAVLAILRASWRQCRLHLRGARRRPLGQPVHGQQRRREDGQRPHRQVDAEHPLSLGRSGEDDRGAGPERGAHHPRTHPRLGRNEPVASDLYHYVDKTSPPVTLKVNGKTAPVRLDKGYVALNRTWKKGDTIELNLPMPVRRVAANSQVAADKGRVALERGRSCTPPNGRTTSAARFAPGADRQPAADHRIQAGSVARCHGSQGEGHCAVSRRAGKDYSEAGRDDGYSLLRLGERGAGQMIVWIPATEAAGTPARFPTITSAAKLTTSGQKSPLAVADEEDPRSSRDRSFYFDWWPAGTATSGWIEYAFDKPATVSESELYWFDDAPRGGVRVPASWRILYKDGADWKPLANSGAGAWAVDKDRYNKVSFKPVSTSALRLEVNFQPNVAAGVQRWRVK